MAKWFIKKPTKTRKSFAIIRDNKTLPTDAVKATNQSYLSGDITLPEAEAIIHKEMNRLRLQDEGHKDKTCLLEVNERILLRYWKAVYEHKIIRSKEAAWNRLRRAVAALDQTPLTADVHDLQRAVNRYPKQQRANVPALNQLLRWMGRTDARLARAKATPTQVNFYSLDQLKQFQLNMPEPVRTLMWVAFSTGSRVGEVFYLQRHHYNPAACYITIEAQRLRDWTVGPPKNRQHRSPVIPEGVPWLERWLGLPDSERRQWRNCRLSEYLKKASGDPKARFHDLRHSYAIHLLGCGISIDRVARALGDNISVVQQYYTGFVLFDHEMEGLHKLLSKA